MSGLPEGRRQEIVDELAEVAIPGSSIRVRPGTGDSG